MGGGTWVAVMLTKFAIRLCGLHYRGEALTRVGKSKEAGPLFCTFLSVVVNGASLDCWFLDWVEWLLSLFHP